MADTKMVALSTLWNAPRHDDGREMVAEIKGLGFGSIEVNYKVTEPMMWDVLSVVGDGEIGVCSLHNFTPIPAHLGREHASGDLFMLSALDESEREAAVRYTKRTIDFAHELGAQVVVLHLGSAVRDVSSSKRLEQRLKSILRKGNFDPIEAESIRQRLKIERERGGKERLNAVFRSLEQLVEYAVKKGVKLGVENRFYYFQIPGFEEISQIFDRFQGAGLYYWHDIGHAQVFEFLGFGQHEAFLKEYGERMLGIHLHDCLKDEDHLAPGMGKVDFGMIIKYLTSETIKVMEQKDGIASEEIVGGLKFLNDHGIR